MFKGVRIDKEMFYERDFKKVRIAIHVALITIDRINL